MEIVMPRLTDSMEEGTIIAWLKATGDEVAVGDELVEIETDKASMVYESDLEGTLKILVDEGETLPIGETIARVGEDGEPADGGGDASPADADTPSETEPSANGSGPDETASEPDDGDPQQDDQEPDAQEDPDPSAREKPDGERIKASPLARRIAGEKGVDLAGVEGSGPGGRIIKADVEGAEPGAEPATEKPPAGKAESGKGQTETVELRRVQQTIARRMAESKATIPHFYLRAEVDMSRAVEVRGAFKEAAGEDQPVPSLNDMVVKAAAVALGRHPRANGAYKDGELELYSRINVGIAVAAEDALVVPVIPGADQKDLREIATESRRLAERVRTGEITPPELSGGTFTVSNLGMLGVRSFDAVINPGQAALLAVGEVAERPVIRDGEMTAAHIMEVSLSCDHRVLYGADGAQFLATIRANLEEPGLLA